MFKVMVVDDDMIVRKGIMTSIAWSEHDIAFTTEAKNGQEAWSKLQEQQIDLILTDIKMPVMNGIELARRVRNELPDIEMVLLSGYEDFQYAKEAMAIGVRHYLLKPILAEKLVATLTEIREQQRSKRLVERKEQYRNILINEHMPLMRTKLMSELIGGKPISNELLEKATTLRIPLTGPYYQVAVIELDAAEDTLSSTAAEAEERKFFACLNIAEETLNGYFSGFLSLHKTRRMVLLANLSDTNSIREVCKTIQANLKRFLKLSVSIGIGEPVGNLERIGYSYESASRSLSGKSLIGKGELIDWIEAKREVSTGCDARHIEVARSGQSPKIVKEAILYMTKHYGEPIGLNEVAEHVRVSPAHLSKVFKEEVGVTFIKWLNHLRMEEAKKLLRHTWLKTYEVADQVGYPDYKYFSLMFKRQTGLSPRDYRNQ